MDCNVHWYRDLLVVLKRLFDSGGSYNGIGGVTTMKLSGHKGFESDIGDFKCLDIFSFCSSAAAHCMHKVDTAAF